MPCVSPNSNALVLVSGANGYIALHAIQCLLAKGYRVRGTVRSGSKAKHLQETFESYGDALPVVVVSDITKVGAFDEYVKDVDAVEHTASPVHTHFDDPQEAIVPAVNGTTSIINSVIEHGKNVKRVVLTSSCAAVHHVADTPLVFSEKSWNEQAPGVVEKEGRAAAPLQKYRAGKVLAERAAWKLYEENKGQGWDLVVLNPPYVFGPPIHEVEEPAALNASMAIWWDTVVKGTMPDQELAATGAGWVDVRDIGLAHQLALEEPAAGGERFIISAGSFKYQDFVDAANDVTSPWLDYTLPKGIYGAGQRAEVVHMIAYDVRKAARLLGLGAGKAYKTVEECTKDCFDEFKKRGWKP